MFVFGTPAVISAQLLFGCRIPLIKQKVQRSADEIFILL